MAGAICTVKGCGHSSNDARPPQCAMTGCPGRETFKPFLHIMPKADDCDHDFQGWREHKDERGRVMGGEQVCTKCGMGAMAHSLRTGP